MAIDSNIKTNRKFVKSQLKVEWLEIEKYYLDLLNRTINSDEELLVWLKDRSELSAVLEEEFAWRYIKMNVDTTNEDLKKAFNFYIKEINPKIAPLENKLNVKLNNCHFKKNLKGKEYEILLRGIETQLALFREENITLFTELEEASQKFGALVGQLSITYKNQEYTLQQASKFLKNTDRTVLKEVYELIANQRSSIVDELNKLYDFLINKRQEVASNAAFNNYRDYKFKSLGRFDYSVDDCLQFHDSILDNVVPLANELDSWRKEKLGLDSLRPYDLSIDIEGKEALKPFSTGKELLTKTIECFNNIDPFFANCLKEMNLLNHLDLESKKGKAPGGFNYPLYESGYPFIYMNAVGAFRDVVTMIHEGGHAIHSVLSHKLELVDFKSTPSEVAELASMSMELISMDNWNVFFYNEEDLNRAKRDHLSDIIKTLPWIATIDKFQHWVYTNKNHSSDRRYKEWLKIEAEFGSDQIDWNGYEDLKKNMWQKQLHLFEVPFYYIEYGIAQLGAIAIWRNYKKDPEKTISQYKSALELGYTKSIGEIYEAAGVKFDFSTNYVKELIEFVYSELEKTKKD